MKVIIAGSRSIDNPLEIVNAVRASGFTISEVVSGAARGVDKLGEDWAKGNGVPVQRFPADWAAFGKAAGVRRNLEMAKYADALIAVWDGQSRGTRHMIEIAKKRGLRVYSSIAHLGCTQRGVTFNTERYKF